ncbi:hypothetical protein NL676_002692 [Syzygium grande]|nr:hypothetical protein NL676_002692 [Syzygium grande]
MEDADNGIKTVVVLGSSLFSRGFLEIPDTLFFIIPPLSALPGILLKFPLVEELRIGNGAKKVSLPLSATSLASATPYRTSAGLLHRIQSPDVSVNAPRFDKIAEFPLTSPEDSLLPIPRTSSTSPQCSSASPETVRSITKDKCTVQILDKAHHAERNHKGEVASCLSFESRQFRFDTSSYQQRAEALEGLLEFSARLLQQQRFDELGVLLKPFGPEKVSPRETAIWLAKSFKDTTVKPKFASRPLPESLPGRHFSVSEEDGEIRTTMERPKAEAAATAMQAYELSYSDLLLLSSPRRHPSPPSEAELRRLDSIRGSVMEALGPAGPGLLCVRDIPEAPALRRELLPLARRLALLVPERRRRILQVFSPMIALLLFSRICTWAAVIGDHLVPIPQYVFDEEIGKAHQLGTDVPMKDPHRSVSSFAMQLRYAQGQRV